LRFAWRVEEEAERLRVTKQRRKKTGCCGLHTSFKSSYTSHFTLGCQLPGFHVSALLPKSLKEKKRKESGE
jgi:hypothetical protein